MWPDAVANAIAQFERFLSQPGQYLTCSPSTSLGPEDARDDLQTALDLLPSGARRDLVRVIGRLDAEFERRTLPEPVAPSGWAVGRWWWQRIREW